MSAALVTAAVVALTACSAHATTTSSPTSSSASSPPSVTRSSTSYPAMADLVGSGCAAYVRANPSGRGSIAGMSIDPVATAISNDPDLSRLDQAISGEVNPKVDLVSTLDASQFTVFAPVDSAFDRMQASTLASLEKPDGAATLSSILTYHVVAGQIAPDAIDGTHTTLEGGSLTVTGSGDDIEVNGHSVICDGIHTANATVYLIDGVLTPPTD